VDDAQVKEFTKYGRIVGHEDCFKKWAREVVVHICKKERAERGSIKNEIDTEPVWDRNCSNCETSPVVRCTGLCGPCTFGEAETANGNW